MEAEWTPFRAQPSWRVGWGRSDVADVFWWPWGGVGDGLLVDRVDEETYGPVAGVTEDQAHVLSTGGNVAVVVSPDQVRILDLVSGQYQGTFPILLRDEEHLVSEACLSPNQHHVAIVARTGEAFVADADSGAVLQRLSGIPPVNSVGWTSDDQLVYISDVAGQTRVQALDISTETIHDVANLRSDRGWWLTASGSLC